MWVMIRAMYFYLSSRNSLFFAMNHFEKTLLVQVLLNVVLELRIVDIAEQ